MSDEDLHDLISKLQAAAFDQLHPADGTAAAPFLNAQLANKAALAISELVATRTLLLARPSNWVNGMDLTRRH